MNKRIKELRKALKLSQEKFGARFGLTGSGICSIESGKRGITEQTTISIVREYNVNYIWLTTGEGEMFDELGSSLTVSLNKIATGNNEFAKDILNALIKFNNDDWIALKKIVAKVSTDVKEVKI